MAPFTHSQPLQSLLRPSTTRRAASALLLILLQACTSSTQQGSVGNNRQQLLLTSATEVERMSGQYFAQQNKEAEKKGQLITSGPEFNRVNSIMRRLVPQTAVFRKDAPNWRWELVLINSPTINAHVMAGGKVTVYTGIIEKLRLNDDEIAAIMGHEMAHALREHTREKISQSNLGDAALTVAGALLGIGQVGLQVANLSRQIGIDLPFSRTMESEADGYGLELSARSGYDPRAAISLWDKMAALGGDRQPGFLSTHPAPSNRKQVLSELLPKVMPLYEASKRTSVASGEGTLGHKQ